MFDAKIGVTIVEVLVVVYISLVCWKVHGVCDGVFLIVGYI